jgi:hypothetical protein
VVWTETSEQVVEVAASVLIVPAVPFSRIDEIELPVATPENSYILKYTSSEVELPPVKVGAEVPVERPTHKCIIPVLLPLAPTGYSVPK